MRLLLDQALPGSTVLHLHNATIEAVHVGDIGSSTATDSKIPALTREEGRVVVTLDADFHALVAGSLRTRSPSSCVKTEAEQSSLCLSTLLPSRQPATALLNCNVIARNFFPSNLLQLTRI
jgi:predicted nuclease of predicted toxin-antitoxin system